MVYIVLIEYVLQGRNITKHVIQLVIARIPENPAWCFSVNLQLVVSLSKNTYKIVQTNYKHCY